MKLPAPNRLAVYLTIVAGLLTAIAPLVADLDTTSTATLLGGLAAIVIAVVKWLSGWQATEKIVQQDELHQRITTREAAAQAEARAQATAPRGANLKLPR